MSQVSMRVARAEEAVRQVGEELDAARTHSTQVRPPALSVGSE